MSTRSSDPGHRKRRTRQHVIADLAVNHVERIILECGHTCQRLVSDYGYDLDVKTFDSLGYIEPGWIYVQVKSMESLLRSRGDFVYDLDIRDYNLWMAEGMPVVLVLYEATKRKAYWVCVQEYFSKASRNRPTKEQRHVRIRIPRQRTLNKRAMNAIRHMKRIIRVH